MFIENYVPVYIPICLAIISVLVGIATKRIPLNLSYLLKCHSELVLALFSFVIWALIAYIQSGQSPNAFSRPIILLNKNTELSLLRVVFLLFINIVLLIGSQIILDRSSDLKTSTTGDAATDGKFITHNTVNWWNGGFLVLSLVMVFTPIWLSQPIPTAPKPIIEYQVSLAYEDHTLEQAAIKYPPASTHNFDVCEIVGTFKATDRADALEQAKTTFMHYHVQPAHNPHHPPGQPQIDDNRSLVERIDEDPIPKIMNLPDQVH